MKKGITWILIVVLAVQLCILPGCSGKDGPDSTGTVSTEPVTSELETNAANAGRDIIREELGLSEAEVAALEATDIKLYDDETVIRYVQYYQDIEIYGSSMLAVSGGDPYCAGTYYDLSEAFGDVFEQLIKDAWTVPKWMTDLSSNNIALIYDKSTLRPVIYIKKEGKAILAYSVEANFSVDDESIMLSLVVSQDGTSIYECNSLDNFDYFTDVYVKGNDDITLSKEGEIYYAYNSEYNFYGINMIGSSKDMKKVAESYSKEDKSLHRRTVELDCELMFKRKSKDWSEGEAETILATMVQFYDVANWYDEHFGWVGLNGNNSPSAVIVTTQGGPLAANYSSAIVIMNTEVSKGPEILAHEFCHSVFYGMTNTPNPTNQAAALNEAVSDAFAALYLGDGSWNLARNTSQPKNIPEEDATMQDYQFDYYIDAYNDEDNSPPPSGIGCYILVMVLVRLKN